MRHDAGDKLGYLGANLAWALKRAELRPGLLALMRRLVDEAAVVGRSRASRCSLPVERAFDYRVPAKLTAGAGVTVGTRVLGAVRRAHGRGRGGRGSIRPTRVADGRSR